MKSKRLSWCMLLLLSLTRLGASSITLSASVESGSSCIDTKMGNQTASCNLSAASNGGSYTGIASASADYGALHVFASSLEAGSGGPFAAAGGQSGAVATTQDSFTLVDAPPTGFLRYVFSITGTQNISLVNESPQLANNDYVLTNLMLNNNSVGGTPFVDEVGIVSSSVTFDLPYTGSTIMSTVALSSATRCLGAQSVNDTISHSCTASGDFSNTVTVIGLGVVDSQGNPVAGSSIIAQSGFNYDPLGSSAPVPEPSTAELLLLGVVAIVTRTLRRRSIHPAVF